MESEIQFLLKILLEHKITPELKKLLLARIGEVEQSLRVKSPGTIQAIGAYAHPANIIAQSPSTQAALMRHMDTNPINVEAIIPPPVIPIEAVAQTPAAQAALMKRNHAIMSGMNDKPEPGRTSPRKF